MTTAVATPLLTVEEFARRPEPQDGSREELVRGKVVTMPPPRFRHGRIQFRIGYLIQTFLDKHPIGQVVCETGVVTHRDPDSVRGPDVAYWSVERLPLDPEIELYPDVAADLCVEVLSRDERPKRVQQKLREYFACGVRMVWLIDPEARTATVFREPTEGRLLCEDARLSGEDVLPGFECRVAELFA